MNLWAQFAKTGNPSVKGIEWKPFETHKRATMILQKKPELRFDILKRQRKLLSPLLKYMLNGSYTELDFNIPFVRKKAAQLAAVAAAGAAITFGIIKIFKKQV